MMTAKEIQKIIKAKVDKLYPDYKGKIENYGNIFHTKKTENGENVIFQTVLSYGVFPISCGLFVKNDLITKHYTNIFKESSTNFEPMFGIYSVPKPKGEVLGFDIAKLEDIDKWIEILKENLQNKEEIFEKYSNLEDLEMFINKEILNLKETDKYDFQHYDVFCGLIASRILEKSYFQNIYEKIMNIAKRNDYSEMTINDIQKTYDYLKNL